MYCNLSPISHSDNVKGQRSRSSFGVFCKCGMVRFPFLPSRQTTVRHCLAWSHPFRLAWSHPFLRSSLSSLQPAQASSRSHIMISRTCGRKASARNRSGSIFHGLETSNPCSPYRSVNSSITTVQGRVWASSDSYQ